MSTPGHKNDICKASVSIMSHVIELLVLFKIWHCFCVPTQGQRGVHHRVYISQLCFFFFKIENDISHIALTDNRLFSFIDNTI